MNTSGNVSKHVEFAPTPTYMPTHVAVLALVFEKSHYRSMFSKRFNHKNLELLLICTAPPTTPTMGQPGISTDIGHDKILGVYIDKTKGVVHSNNHIHTLDQTKHDILCVPLTTEEYNNVIVFLHGVKDCTYNAWDAILSATATLIPLHTLNDITITENQNATHDIKCLHSAQLATLLIRHGLEQTNKITAKLWGYNSRLINSDEIFEQLRGTCVQLDCTSLREGELKVLHGTPYNTNPPRKVYGKKLFRGYANF